MIRNVQAEGRMALIANMLARAVNALLPEGMGFCIIVYDPKASAWGACGSGEGAACLEIAKMAVRTYEGTLTDPSSTQPKPDRSAN